jgi:hypothetical protein
MPLPCVRPQWEGREREREREREASLLSEKNPNRPSGRPSAGRRADLGASPVAGWPTSGPEGRFTVRKQYCMTRAPLPPALRARRFCSGCFGDSRKSRSIVPGRESIGPAPGSILLAGFGNLRTQNSARSGGTIDRFLARIYRSATPRIHPKRPIRKVLRQTSRTQSISHKSSSCSPGRSCEVRVAVHTEDGQGSCPALS